MSLEGMHRGDDGVDGLTSHDARLNLRSLQGAPPASSLQEGDTGLPVVRIRASEHPVWARLREVWQYRELLAFLAWRDIKVRYKQTVLGAAWAVLQPVLMVAIFTFALGRIVRLPSDGLPYPLFALCGMVPWQLFAYALTSSANSLVAGERLVTKAYFPRLVMPIASVLAGLVDFAIAFALLLVVMLFYGLPPGPAAWAVPLFLLLTVMAAMAVGLGLSALNVRFRDVRYALPFLTQFWFFATPIAYPSSLLPEGRQILFGLNPMAGVVEGFRWALLGSSGPPGPMLLVSTAVVLVGLVVSTSYFLRVERSFADIL